MAEKQGWYVYAITKAGASPDLRALSGVSGAKEQGDSALEMVTDGPVAAVASRFEGGRIRAERRNLAAHHKVISSLTRGGVPFLPVSFGVVAPSRDQLEELLRVNRNDLVQDLERLGGTVEMGLKVVWDVDNIFEFFIFRNPELAEMRDRMKKKPGGIAHGEKIELGMAFESMMDEARERKKTMVMRGLESCVIEFKVNPPPDEKVIMNLACLIARDQEKAFEKVLFEVASNFDENYAFDYNGPWPPYHFVQASLGAPGEDDSTNECANECSEEA